MKLTRTEFVLASMKRALKPVAASYIANDSYCASKSMVKRWVRLLESDGKPAKRAREK